MHENEINELKNKVRETYFKNDFTGSIKHCNELMKVNDSDIKWFATYQRALAYKKLGNIKLALRYAKKSLNFIEDFNDNILNHKFTSSQWLKASCFEEKGNILKALNLHADCVEYFRRVGDTKLMLISMYNIAKIKIDVEEMERIIGLFIENNFKSKIHLYEEDMGYVVIVKQMLTELYKINKESALKTINGLENKELKINLEKNLVA